MDRVYEELKNIIKETYYEKKKMYELDIKLKNKNNFTEKLTDVDWSENYSH